MPSVNIRLFRGSKTDKKRMTKRVDQHMLKYYYLKVLDVKNRIRRYSSCARQQYAKKSHIDAYWNLPYSRIGSISGSRVVLIYYKL